MRVRLLGPVDVVVDGELQLLRGLRRKAVLAVLALSPGELVSMDRLVDAVWDGRPPASAPNTIQSHVSYLRRTLGGRDVIVSRPPGYVLDLGDGATDVLAARRLLRQAERSVDAVARARHLREAVDLWRGAPLADLSELDWFARHAEQLEALRLEALQALLDARLDLSEHLELLPELEHLAQRYPFHERLHGRLMLALYRADRQAEALAVCQRLRRSLDDELGIVPSEAIRELELAVLRQDPALNAPPRPATPATPTRDAPGRDALNSAVAGRGVPRQLPADIAGFAGRTSTLSTLDGLLASSATAATMLIVAVSGSPGVGKTTTVVHWAHRVAAQFPDGQLYLDLRGYDPNGQAVDAAEAIRTVLDALGAPPQRLPASPAAMEGTYRSAMAGRRILLVLDNARDAQHVRPLLPASPTAAVVVTSRSNLAPLVAREGAHPVSLDLLTVDDSRDLLRRRLGADWTAGQPFEVDEIIRRCARLPLALAVIAARIATRQPISPDQVLQELGDAPKTLSYLDGGDALTDVRAVFSLSYRTLGEPAARLFRLLGTHPGPHVTVSAAASLCGAPPREVGPLVDELARAHLLRQVGPERFEQHDLMRAYAAEIVEESEAAAVRADATDRLLEHYLSAAVAAAHAVNPQTDVDPPTVAAPSPAMAWFMTELPVLVSLVQLAEGTARERHAWQLAWTLTDALERQGLWSAWETAHRAGLRAAQRLGDPLAQAYLRRGLGRLAMWRGDFGRSAHELQTALRLYEQAGHLDGQCRAEHNLSQMSDMAGTHHDALRHGQQALALAHRTGVPALIGKELNTVGWCHATLGEFDRALTCCQRALAIFAELDDPAQESATLDSLGYAHHHLGHFADAVDHYERALVLHRQTGDRYHEAHTMVNLGDSQAAMRHSEPARRSWQQAEAILSDLGHPDADAVRDRLNRP